MRRRVLGTVVAACVLGLGVFFVPTAVALYSRSQHQDLLELQRLAATAARGAADAPIRQWRPPADHPDHIYAVYDADGRRLAGQGPAWADAVTEEARRTGVAAARTDAAIVAAATADPTGARVVRVSEPLAESKLRTAAQLAALLLLGAAAAAVATGTGWWLTRRLLRPLQALHQAAASAGSGTVVTAFPPSGLTEIDQIGQALTDSHRRLLATLARERSLAADASHQLRTPLAGAITVLEAEQLHPRADHTEALREALDGLRRLQTTVDDLLAAAREAPQRQAVPLPDALAEVAATWRPRFAAAGRCLSVDSSDLAPVDGIPSAVHQILHVLLDNAWQHGAGTTRVTAADTVGGAVVTVSDAGTGPPHPATLFLRRDPHAAGTGLGLGLARDLAEASGARLRFAGYDPTRFELLLPRSDPVPPAGVPLQRVDPARPPDDRAPGRRSAAAPPGTHRRVSQARERPRPW